MIRKIKIWFYKIFHKIIIDIDNSMLYKIGKGKYVSVYQKGKYTDIVKENTKEKIRLYPFQPNHGIFVEYYNDKENIQMRRHMSFEDFKKYLEKGIEK